MRYAAILGEALVDLLETPAGTGPIYRSAIGGAPLNVAVGVRRLGGAAHFVGALSDDLWGDRIAAFLTDNDVDIQGVRRVPAPTTLALTTFAGPEPQFRFYGAPASYAQLRTADLDPAMLAGAAVLYTGSISLLAEPIAAAARKAWAQPGPLRVLDPNVRPALLPDRAAVGHLRELIEDFSATADLVKLSEADAAALYDGAGAEEAATRLRAVGAAAVVVTLGSRGAWLDADDEATAIAAPAVAAVDTTGAGDSVMAALVSRLLDDGRPDGIARWCDDVHFALHVAGHVCEHHGGAAAMPTLADVQKRWGLSAARP
jgi:fructokinase